MVNLYDTPAQAQFINTYVPIQFEGLYKLADKASNDLKEGNQMLDAISKFKSLGSRSDVDNESWNNIVSEKLKWMNDNISTPYDLQDPLKRAKLYSIIRDFESDANLKKLAEGKVAIDKFDESVDPMWNGAYSGKIKGYNTLQNGVISGKALDYADYAKVADDLFKDMKPRILERDGFRTFSGNDISDISGIVNENKESLITNPSLILKADQDNSRGIVDDKYYTLDKETGKYNFERDQYILDNVISAGLDRTIGRTEDVDQVKLAIWKNAEANRRHAATLAQKERLENMNNISQIWLQDQAKTIIDKKYNTADKAIAMAMNNARKGIADPIKANMAAEEAGKKVFGESAYLRYQLNRQASTIDNEISTLNDQRATALAKGDKNTAKILTNQIETKTKDYNNILKKRDAVSGTALDEINNEITNSTSLRVGGRFSQDDIKYMTSVDIPNGMAEEWMDITTGKPVKVKTQANKDVILFSLDNVNGVDLVSRMDISSNVLNSFTRNGLKLKYTTYKYNNSTKKRVPVPGSYVSTGEFNTAITNFKNSLTSRVFGSDVMIKPSGKGQFVGGTAYGTSDVYVRKSELKKNLSPKDFAIIMAISGGKPENLYIDEIQVNGNETRTVSQPYEYVKVPMSYEFISSGERGAKEIILDNRTKMKAGKNVITNQSYYNETDYVSEEE